MSTRNLLTLTPGSARETKSSLDSMRGFSKFLQAREYHRAAMNALKLSKVNLAYDTLCRVLHAILQAVSCRGPMEQSDMGPFVANLKPSFRSMLVSSTRYANRGATSASGHVSNLPTILKEASMQYKDLTGEDLATHPCAAELDNWSSVDTVLNLFQRQAQGFNEVRKGNKKLLEWLAPLVQTVVAVLGPIGDGLVGVGPRDYFFRLAVLTLIRSHSLPQKLFSFVLVLCSR